MSIYLDKFSSLFGGTSQFNTEEIEELGKFAAQVLSAKAMGDVEEVVNCFREAAEPMDENTIRRTDSFLRCVAETDPFFKEGEKTAGIVEWFKPKPTGLDAVIQGAKGIWGKTMGTGVPPMDKVRTALLLLGIAVGSLPVAAGMLGKFKHAVIRPAAKQSVLNKFPRLRSELSPAEFNQQFDTIADAAPDVGANPYLMGQIMMNVLEGGGAAILPNMLAQQVMPIQDKIQSTRKQEVTPASKAMVDATSKWPWSGE